MLRSVPIMTFECVHAWTHGSSMKEGFLGLGSKWNKVFERKARTVGQTNGSQKPFLRIWEKTAKFEECSLLLRLCNT